MLLSLAIPFTRCGMAIDSRFRMNHKAINMPMPETDMNLTPVKALNLVVAGVQRCNCFLEEERWQAMTGLKGVKRFVYIIRENRLESNVKPYHARVLTM